jgi:hypothetical protein
MHVNQRNWAWAMVPVPSQPARSGPYLRLFKFWQKRIRPCLYGILLQSWSRVMSMAVQYSYMSHPPRLVRLLVNQLRHLGGRDPSLEGQHPTRHQVFILQSPCHPLQPRFMDHDTVPLSPSLEAGLTLKLQPALVAPLCLPFTKGILSYIALGAEMVLPVYQDGSVATAPRV